ncbi:substrate-binding domain-containing protein [Robinsoniella peoriensis]|uniref:substrate-binding domain-containing protein n=1 Tax=Robinsoniella peoriensis TaxID=180332 RepID=UPI0006934984|nr:substrate-binding domain-containing protein [Robinsoniella peoriensis]
MRRYKKMLGILLTVAMSVSMLSACGGTTKSSDADTAAKTEAQAETKAAETKAAETKEPVTESAKETASEAVTEAEKKADASGKSFKVGYVNKTLNNPYFVALDAALKEEVESRGWSYASLDASEDISKEMENMETFVSQNYDCIIMNCVDSEACLPAIANATAAGIPVINVDNACDTSADNITTVCSDNLRNGRAVGLYVGEQFGKDPIVSVLLSGVKGAVVSQERRTGLMCGIIEQRTGCTEDEAWAAAKTMEQELMDKGKAENADADFKINGQGWGNWTADEGLPAMEDLLVANKDINLVLGENDNMLLGAMTAIENAGLTDKIKLAAAADGQKEAIKLIADNTGYIATGDNNPKTVAAMAMQVADDVLLNGKTADDYEDITRTPPLCYTIENAKDYYDENAAF